MNTYMTTKYENTHNMNTYMTTKYENTHNMNTYMTTKYENKRLALASNPQIRIPDVRPSKYVTKIQPQFVFYIQNKCLSPLPIMTQRQIILSYHNVT